MLDTRSRPADLSPGAFRYKLNWGVNLSGKLCRRSGHSAFSLGLRSDDPEAVANWDYHRQGHDREPVTMGFQHVATDGARRLFLGAETTLATLDNDTSEWTEIFNGATGAGARWKAAGLGNKVFFTNNVIAPRVYTIGGLSSSTIAGLTSGVGNPNLTRARIVLSFAKVIIWMNVVEDGDRFISRVRWSNFGDGTDYSTATSGAVTGFSDLETDDEILNAVELYNAIYIFTTRSIWRMTVSASGSLAFGFTRIYTEPRNKSGCLAYPNTLVSNGKELFWLSRDSAWTFNPYTAAPEASDWLLYATGHLFSATNPDAIETRCCESAICEYWPDTKEIWLSYPLATAAVEPNCVNNRTLVLNTDYKTADIVDQGYTMFVNFSKTAASAQVCNSGQYFIGASGTDYSLKSIGGVFHRENVALVDGSAINDVSDVAYATTLDGYYSRIVGRVPTGYPQLEKTLRGVIVEHDTVPQDDPNLLTLRIGNSAHLTDPMSLDVHCGPQWHAQEDLELSCPDERSMTALEADNLRPSDPVTDWSMFEEGRHLYYDIRIVKNDTGKSAPVGSDTAWSAITFDLRVK